MGEFRLQSEGIRSTLLIIEKPECAKGLATLLAKYTQGFPSTMKYSNKNLISLQSLIIM